MGAYRYCHACRDPQGPITIDDIALSDGRPLVCVHCGAWREDDTGGQRVSVLAAALVDLRDAFAEFRRDVLDAGGPRR